MTSQTPASQPGFNIFAILSIIFVWFAGVLGLIFGYIALSQIKKTGERGRGLALASVILGWIAIGFAVIITIFVLIAAGAAVTQA
ncbi:DUF4190 domain-containing protein [Microbacter sp. GSS18]|nr:DUF4190 domain-containing protein [Microbacter sp. GSS18]